MNRRCAIRPDFTGQQPYEIETGLPKSNGNPSYTDIFSTVMRKIRRPEPDVVAVSAAMVPGTGLKRFGNMYPDRLFDVGIAEEHAVTFAAGTGTWRPSPGGRDLFVIFAARDRSDHCTMCVCRIFRSYLPWTAQV